MKKKKHWNMAHYFAIVLVALRKRSRKCPISVWEMQDGYSFAIGSTISAIRNCADFLESPIMQLMRHLQKFFEQDDIQNM